MSMNAIRYHPTAGASPRDRSRLAESRLATLSRKSQRRAKSAMLFLAFAFPAEPVF